MNEGSGSKQTFRGMIAHMTDRPFTRNERKILENKHGTKLKQVYLGLSTWALVNPHGRGVYVKINERWSLGRYLHRLLREKMAST